MKKYLFIILIILIIFNINNHNIDKNKIQIKTTVIDNNPYIPPLQTFVENFKIYIKGNNTTKSISITSPSPIIPMLKTINEIEVIDKIINSVVMIQIYNNTKKIISSGSGFLIDKNKIITCFHVITKGTIANIKIYDNDLKSYDISEIQYIQDMDIAILTTTFNGLPIILADSLNIKNGEEIYTLSSPLGLINSTSKGIISRISRLTDRGISIQFDAPISQGSSGGLLINKHGDAIGMINSSVIEGQELNFAIPSNVLKQNIIKLKKRE